VEYVREIMKMGTGADRQLQVYRETGDMKAVMDYIMEETEVGVNEVESEAAARTG
jgi:carboxylate-amine ligase